MITQDPFTSTEPRCLNVTFTSRACNDDWMYEAFCKDLLRQAAIERTKSFWFNPIKQTIKNSIINSNIKINIRNQLPYKFRVNEIKL